MSGTGYQAGEIVLIRYRGTVVQAATVDSHGNYGKAGFQVPVNSPYGTFAVTATGARSGRSASSSVHVTVTPPAIGIAVLHTTVKQNGTVTVSGHGFKAGETILLRLNGQVVQASRADSHGNFGRTSFRLGFSAHNGKGDIAGHRRPKRSSRPAHHHHRLTAGWFQAPTSFAAVGAPARVSLSGEGRM